MALIAALGLGCSTTMSAQVPSDSIARWTRALQVGTMVERGAAVDGLTQVQVRELPPETVQALLAELGRIHRALLDHTVLIVPGVEEDHGEYYISLVTIVSGLRTREAALALVPAIEVSGGVQRRVARLGDDVVLPLLDLIERRYSEADALETLGLLWFWADSTGGALSSRSRGLILEAFAAASASGEFGYLLGVTTALLAMRDPTFLELARLLRSNAATLGVPGQFVLVDDDDVISLLRVAATARASEEIVQRISLVVQAVCGLPATGRRFGTCQSVLNQVTTGQAHFAAGRMGPARNVYSSVADRLRRARDDGEFTTAEYALLSGDLNLLLGRPW